jgi:hypothetical protein
MRKLIRAALSSIAVAAFSQANHALTFNFNPAPGTSLQAVNGFISAGNRWSALFSDSMTVNIDINFAPLAPGVLGQANSAQYIGGYGTFLGRMIADATSASDATALASLPLPTVGALVNGTTEHPTTGYDNDSSYNNSVIRGTAAQLKAMNLINPFGAASDASISFSSSFAFDFNPTDGITAGAFDFIGMATHEIGHALGFISGVDLRDFYNSTHQSLGSENTLGYEATVMDLFRFSGPLGSAQRDWTIGTGNKFFTIDGGATSIAPFSTGSSFGDGQQASHWKDSLSIGILDPTAAPGELLAITPNDILMFDVLGYDLAANAVPEASTVWAGIAFAAIAASRLRRKARQA